ncbi:alpha/beta fold hydrolase [Paraburkholderia saeva]|uniref:Aminoacrylate hydrolase RutD n=1 Tax=Paraburkholderia saeva TaxID=2777537 RepID=A0A9N8RWA4_9BURK|nr:alpha/beta hydrolase [Paraburkholderia saeva]CAG4887569.1 Putative aminoacrylate hydrolase RutD [Paraburkholderia saeva]CAG4895170.1 Putative aminoacrylate hydrolase RutD [Paraburkholderia saeva]CAG4897838.1 Putative aminoacrylate hydrolase RutD [Paraburkholderia saeva]
MSTWILLRGLTREARHWGTLPALLGAATDTEHVLLPDLPGNGIHTRLRAPLDVVDMVGFVRLVAVQSGLPKPYRLLAMSLGGMVATAWAQRHPQDIERIVLINTSMRPFSRARERLRSEAWPELLRIAAKWGDPQEVESAVHRLTCSNRQNIVDDLVVWRTIRASAPVSRVNALRQLFAAAQFNAGKTPPSCPALILSSEDDRLVNPVCSAHLAAAWRAPHRRHPWAGHDLPHDDSAWVCETISEWLVQSEDPSSFTISQ